MAPVIVSNSYEYLPFNEVLMAKIECRIVVAVSDALLKDS